MSLLVSKIKEKVHRKSASLTNEEETVSRTSREWGDLTIRPLTAQGPTHISLENSAFHIHRGGGVRASFERSPTTNSHGSNTVDDSHDIRPRILPEYSISMLDDGIPDRASSKHAVATSRAETQAKRNDHHEVSATEDLIPQRESSKYISDTYAIGYQDWEIAPNGVEKATMDLVLPFRETPQQTAHILPQDTCFSIASQGVSSLSRENDQLGTAHCPRSDRFDDSVGRDRSARTTVPEQIKVAKGTHVREKENRGSKSSTVLEPASAAIGHLRLPPGFSIQDTEQTHVTEIHRPAVTHETIIKQKTEVVQEVIERDIHVHHYYTYLQPVRVVEVLPAKHFVFDPDTGIKTEIPAPPGWKMPANMTPISPDISTVTGWTRHYLVDGDHPHGILEQPTTE